MKPSVSVSVCGDVERPARLAPPELRSLMNAELTDGRQPHHGHVDQRRGRAQLGGDPCRAGKKKKPFIPNGPVFHLTPRAGPVDGQSRPDVRYANTCTLRRHGQPQCRGQTLTRSRGTL